MLAWSPGVCLPFGQGSGRSNFSLMGARKCGGRSARGSCRTRERMCGRPDGCRARPQNAVVDGANALATAR